MKIPLEDTYADILSKARRGLGLDLDTLSARAGRALCPGEPDPRGFI